MWPQQCWLWSSSSSGHTDTAQSLHQTGEQSVLSFTGQAQLSSL